MNETTSYTCPLHGEYHMPEDPLRWRVWDGECRTCRKAADEARDDGRREVRRRSLWNTSNTPRRFDGHLREHWRPQGKVQQKAAERIAEWVARFPRTGGRGLTLLGPPGTGKTMLLATLVREWIETTSRAGLFWDWPDLLTTLRGDWAEKRKSDAADRIDGARSCDLLALDELALRHMREGFETDLLFEIINARYNDKLPTLIASNAPDLNALGAAVGERVVDRLRETNALLLLPGDSMRGRAPAVEPEFWPKVPDRITVEVCQRGVMRSETIELVTYRGPNGMVAL